MQTTDRTKSIHAEQSIIGALLIDNESINNIPDLKDEYFYNSEHRAFFGEIVRQITAGETVDAISIGSALADKVPNCMRYITEIVNSTLSTRQIKAHAEIVTECALRRALSATSSELQEIATTSHESIYSIIDAAATKIEELGQKKTRKDPIKFSDSLGDYVVVLEKRMDGGIKPISTGHVDLDKKLGGGFERGTLTVLAGRPAMGKSAAGLDFCRSVANEGFSAGFLSMEMDIRQVNDRNIAAIGKIPIDWLRSPTSKDDCAEDEKNWNNLTFAMQKAREMKFYIDDETNLNMLEIRNKARQIKRKNGLDLLVIDQLSFITGGAKEKKTYELVGEYTRGLIALAKQLDMSVVLLCQLNRECENRTNKRPQMSDLALSGSIEQDAANIIFIYRDEVYNPNSQDKGICEFNIAKQRQGETGVVVMTYYGHQARFEDYAGRWEPPPPQPKTKSGFD